MALNLEIDQTFIAAAVSEEQNSDKLTSPPESIGQS
jgi:hypothetical protein